MSDEKRAPGGLSAKTILIAAVASAAAALVIPMLWRPGTVFAAAMTPVVVALVSEMLRRPVETVSAVRVRRTPRGTAILDPVEPETEEFDPLAPPSAEDLLILPDQPPPAPRAEHRRAPLSARQWKLALVTGLVAFVAVAGIVTASDLVTGDAVSGGGRTTFFGGGSSSKAESEQGDRAKEKKRSKQDEQPQATATPAASATPEPTATATPSPSATATPAPQQTATPAPASPAPTP